MSVLQVQMLGWSHLASGTQFGDLFLSQVAWGTPHRVKGLENIAVVIVEAEHFGSCVCRNTLEVRTKILAGPAVPLGMM